MTICIIPARSGSKRVKNKNIKLFAGKPIISYAIQLAKSCGLFKKIVVSTDSYKISKIAKKYGAEVPFLRSKKLANDFTPTSDVLIDCINKKRKKLFSKEGCDHVECINCKLIFLNHVFKDKYVFFFHMFFLEITSNFKKAVLQDILN